MYHTNNDLYLAFGKANIDQWADVDNNSVYSSIEARLNWANEQAASYLDSRLSKSVYQFPLPSQTYPPILVLMSAYYAAVLLYESRGVTDVGPHGNAMHALQWHRKAVETFVQDVFARRVTLDVTLRADAVAASERHDTPEFVSFDDPAYNRGLVVGDNLIDEYVR